MIRKTAFFICMLFAVLMLFGCSESKNAQLVGTWTPATVSINGETIKYNELELEENEFSLIFDASGNCKVTLAGITHNTKYVFNDTSVDIQLNGETKKLAYENSSLTLTLDYGTDVTAFTFKKSE